jgi:drug/metabolite transporter (DMT)-like permease
LIGARLAIIAAAALFSTGGAAIKAASFTAWQVACLRSAIAAVVLLSFVPAARRGWSWRMVGVAVAYAVTLVSYVTASKLTTAANAIFLEETAPVYLVLAGPLLLKERARRVDLVVIALMAAGLAIFFAGSESATAIAPDPWRGNLIGAATGFTWAITIAGLRWLSRGNDGAAVATAAMGNVLAAVATIGFAWPFSAARVTDWLAVGYLGVFQVGLAYVLLARGLRGVAALEASLLILVEPALTPVWAGLLHGEWPSALSTLGGALIVGATAVQLLMPPERRLRAKLPALLDRDN